MGTIYLSLASKESRAWSQGFHRLLYSGCNPKEAGVREKWNEVRKLGESIWRCVIKLVTIECDQLLHLTRRSSQETILQKAAQIASQTVIQGEEGGTVYPPVPICPMRLFIATHFGVGTCHTWVSAGKPWGRWQEPGLMPPEALRA